MLPPTMSATKAMESGSDATGLRLIVGYKMVKAVAEIALAVVLVSVALAGGAHVLREFAMRVREHATAAWSVALAQRLVRAATGRHLQVAALASLLDGVFSGIEGWALHRRFAWSRWLIVGATSALVPFEIVSLVHRHSAGRLALLCLNVVIVVYLVLEARRHASSSALRRSR